MRRVKNRTRWIQFFLLVILLSPAGLAGAEGSLKDLLVEFQQRYLTTPGYPEDPGLVEDVQALAAHSFQHLVLEPQVAERDRALLDLVETIKGSPLTIVYLPVIRNLQEGVGFYLLHQPGSRHLAQLKNELDLLLAAVQEDALIDGYPANSSLKINRDALWTNSNKLNLEVQVDTCNGRVTEMAFSEDGVVFQPFIPLAGLVGEFVMSDREGPRTLWVIFRTDHGKIGGMAFDTIDYDRTPPEGSFTINNGESVVEKHKLILHLQVKDAFLDGIFVQVKVTDGEANPPFRAFQNTLETYLFGLGGEKTVTVTLKDKFGQTAPPISRLITLHF